MPFFIDNYYSMVLYAVINKYIYNPMSFKTSKTANNNNNNNSTNACGANPPSSANL